MKNPVMRLKNSFLVLTMLAWLPAAPAGAATDYLLELDGLKAETSATGSGTLDRAAVTTSVIDDVSATPRTAPEATTAFGVVGTPFILDGSKSIDDAVVRTFTWRQTSGPTVAWPDAKSAKLSVVPPAAGTYVFELAVTDAKGVASVVQKSTVVVREGGSGSADATSGSLGGGEPVKLEPPKDSTDPRLDIGSVNGESTKGQEPQAPGLDVTTAPAEVMPDFSILLGGGGGDDAQERRDAVADILMQGLVADGVRAESVTIGASTVTAEVRTTVKMFGFIPVIVTAVADVDAKGMVKVKFPWWTFVASGKDADGLGQRIFTSISNVLKTKHDTVKNSIGNIR